MSSSHLVEKLFFYSSSYRESIASLSLAKLTSFMGKVGKAYLRSLITSLAHKILFLPLNDRDVRNF